MLILDGLAKIVFILFSSSGYFFKNLDHTSASSAYTMYNSFEKAYSHIIELLKSLNLLINYFFNFSIQLFILKLKQLTSSYTFIYYCIDSSKSSYSC